MRQLASVRMILLVSALLNVLTYTLIPVAATISGVIAAWRTPGPRLRSFVQHFATGVVVAAAAGKMNPATRISTAKYLSPGLVPGQPMTPDLLMALNEW